jgi:hypothetical protein
MTICQAESKVVREVLLLLFTGSFSHSKGHKGFLQASTCERAFILASTCERERERAFVFIAKLGQRVVFNQP